MNILITGGASGLGKAICCLLAKNEGNTVYFTYNKSFAQARQVETDFPNTRAIKCDFKNAEEVKGLLEKIDMLTIDVLINNAYSGKPVKNHFHKMNAIDFQSEFMFDILPVIRITQASIKNFRKKNGGRIVTILSSYLLNTPPAGASAYVAGKAYLASLVKSWAAENIKYNISSNSVSPSFMRTGLAYDVDERIVEQLIANHPLKKLLTVEETAEAVSFLVNAPLHINGIDLVINAGANFK